MKNLQYFGSVSKTGILNIPNRKRLQSDLLSFAGCTVELTIKKKNRRSSPQNRYYFGVVVAEIRARLNELGNDLTPEQVHEILKYKFNPLNIVGEGGEIIDSLGGSTAEMNKEEFGVYLDKIFVWALEFLNITIPAPDSDLQFKF